MLFVVLAQNEFGLRDAWHVDGDDVVEAMSEAGERMIAAGISPETVTVLPAKDNRTVPYMFPNDPATDAELVLDFLRGYIRPVLTDYATLCELTDGGGYDVEQRAKRLATDAEVCGETSAKIFQFPTTDEAEQSEE